MFSGTTIFEQSVGVIKLILSAMVPGFPGFVSNSCLFLVVRPGTPSNVLVPGNDALCY